jgi:hypothetical protein
MKGKTLSLGAKPASGVASSRGPWGTRLFLRGQERQSPGDSMGMVFNSQAERRKRTRGGSSSQTSLRPLSQRTVTGVRAIFSKEKRRCWQSQILAGQ